MTFYILLTHFSVQSQNQSWLEKVCYHELTRSLEHTKKSLQKLLSLNKVSTQLKQENLRLNKLLIAATLSGQHALIAYYEQKLSENWIRRIRLDQKQKRIIFLSNENTKRDFFELKRKISSVKIKILLQNEGFTESSIHFTGWKIPTMAVMPQGTDIAPNYVLETDFSQQQKWSLFWKAAYTTLQLEERTRECSVTLIPSTKKVDFKVVRAVKL